MIFYQNIFREIDRSIDRSLHPTRRMSWTFVRLWGFVCVGNTGRRGNKITGFPDRIGIYKCWFLKRWENEVLGEKPLGARERTNIKLNPHVATKSGFEPGPHWWEASTLTTALPLLWWRTPYNGPYGDALLGLIRGTFCRRRVYKRVRRLLVEVYELKGRQIHHFGL